MLKYILPRNYHAEKISWWVSEWLLFNANYAIFPLYNGENKLHFDDDDDALY